MGANFRDKPKLPEVIFAALNFVAALASLKMAYDVVYFYHMVDIQCSYGYTEENQAMETLLELHSCSSAVCMTWTFSLTVKKTNEPRLTTDYDW